MPTPPLSKALAQEALDAYTALGGVGASKALSVQRGTLMGRVRSAQIMGLQPKKAKSKASTTTSDADMMRERIKRLEVEARQNSERIVSAKIIREEIIGLKKAVEVAPKVGWLCRKKTVSATYPGVPLLFASDWHWGEIVNPKEIGGVNAYNLEIAHERARKLITKTIELLYDHMVNPDYPGIVFALGGDMVSGDIHEEITENNEVPMMPVMIDVFGVLTWCIETLADAFGNVFVPCVTGNHGRNTKKPRKKGRNYTNFDWLLYQFLAKRFENDKRVIFYIPDGPDAQFNIYNHRYLLTHGDQFRGGDGMIGALGPITRGDHKKRSRNMQIGAGYDTMIIGHWHQLIQLRKLVVNGSLKGYDEYAFDGNFSFELPQQALWLTHPEHGITIQMPVFVDRSTLPETSGPWVSFPGA